MHDQRRSDAGRQQHQDPAAHQQRDAGRQAETHQMAGERGNDVRDGTNPAADHRHQSNVGQSQHRERHVSARTSAPQVSGRHTQTRPPLAIDVVKPIQTICSI
jgi:hypothetical protein